MAEALAVRTHGTGTPTTVLVHGWAVSGAVWNSVAERWSDGTLVVVDLRGTGDTGVRGDAGYHYTEHGADLIALIEDLGGPVRLVGHSMGGMICQWVASQRPDLLSRLVLVSPTPAGGVPLEDEQVAYFESLYDDPNALISMMLAAPVSPDALAGCVDDVRRTSREAFIGGFASWRGADFAAQLGDINTPTAVLGGALEQPLNPGVLQAAVVDLIAGAELRVLPDVGHYPQLEAPDAFFTALMAALQG